ncbi:HNH endonuclease [Vibrio fluvialis]|uniref:HNH endonuclease n=1 Tax=Vibrio fluvialis TaxID=676 RepID=UPI001BB0640A|nr:HNH endonuclease [Vibrio fluvialis]QUF70049.1 HNH endonuclease [Vibrio fluvialis]
MRTKKKIKVCATKGCRKHVDTKSKTRTKFCNSCLEIKAIIKSEQNTCQVCGKLTKNKVYCSRDCQLQENESKAITRFLQHSFGFWLFSVSQRKGGFQTLEGNSRESLEQLYQLHKEMRSRNRSLATIDNPSPRTYQLCHLHPLSKGGATHPSNLVIGTASVNNKLKANDFGWGKYVPVVTLPDTVKKLTPSEWFSAVNNMLNGELIAFVRERKFYKANIKEEYSNHPDNLTKFEDSFFYLEFPVADWEVAHSIPQEKVDTDFNFELLKMDYRERFKDEGGLLSRLKRYEQEYFTDSDELETLFFTRFNRAV